MCLVVAGLTTKQAAPRPSRCGVSTDSRATKKAQPTATCGEPSRSGCLLTDLGMLGLATAAVRQKAQPTLQSVPTVEWLFGTVFLVRVEMSWELVQNVVPKIAALLNFEHVFYSAG